MRCKNCTHYDVCYQYDIIGEDDSEMCALYEQKRPHGEWVESKERKGHFYCSECVKKDPETGKWRETFDFKYPFCPNCGSDNRGTER